MSENTQSKYFPALTGVRAIAAYLVFIHHYVPAKTSVGTFLHLFFTQGYIGVSVFFVLSGFLIHQRYGNSFEFTWSYISNYTLNRFSRIYPLYLVLATLTLIAAREESTYVWFLNLSLFKGFFTQWKFSHISQAWSLTVEECFYFSAPIIFWLINRKRLGLIALTFLFLLIGVALLAIGQGLNIQGFFSPIRFLLLYTFFGRSFDFLIGIYFSKKLNELTKKTNGHSTYLGVLYSVLGLVALTSVSYYFNKDIAIFKTAGLVINNWILPYGIGLTIYGLCLERTWLSCILGGKLFNILGKSSYAFYLIHMGIIMLFISSFKLGMLVNFILLNVISVGIFLFYESPINNLIRRKKGLFAEARILLLRL